MFDAATFTLLKDKITALPQVVVERSLSRDIDELVAGVLPPMKLAVVDDRRTAAAYGDKVFRALKSRFATTHVTLDAPRADDETANYLHMQTLSADALVAVGSGTISDLCKHVSHENEKPYIIFPTAASMNGYLSANASLAVSGYKKTLPAHMPKAVLCDLAMIAAAPQRLSKSGFGDSLARPTAQADWLLSHLLLNTPYDETPFKLLAPVEPELFGNARGIALGDEASIALLMKTLLLSGLGMTIAGGSYPASQAEHMIAHAMGMLLTYPSRLREGSGEGGNITPPPSGSPRKRGENKTLHGEEVGVTTLAMARMQEKLLHGNPTFRPNDFDEEKIAELFGNKVAQEAKKAFAVKFPSPIRGEADALKPSPSGRGLGEGLSSPLTSHAGRDPHPGPLPEGEGVKDWPSIATQITAIHIPPTQLQSLLEAAEAPTTPEKLGWNAKDYDTATKTARYLRERFTFLDLVTSG